MSNFFLFILNITSFILFTILKLYVYNYLAYVRTKPMFNHYYNIPREELDVDQAINWLSDILLEK